MSRPRISHPLALLLFTVATALMAWGHFSIEVDIENMAMRSLGTPQAESIRLREEAFGSDIVLILAVESEREQDYGRWLTGLHSSARLRSLRETPSLQKDVRVWIAELEVPADGRYATRAAAFERLARGTLPGGAQLLVAGQPLAETVIAEELAAENRMIVPLILGALFLALWGIYSSLVMALGGLLPPLAGVLWIGGLQKLMGLSLDPISTLLAPTLVAIGVATSVHVLEKYRQLILSGEERVQAAQSAARGLWRPTGLAVITTLAGFFGLIANSMPAVHRFGYLASLGVVLTCFFSLTLLPIWLATFQRAPLPRPASGRALQRLFKWVQAHRKALLMLCFGMAISMGWNWSTLQVDTDPLRVLPSDHSYRIATHSIEEALGAVDTFEVLFEAKLKPPSTEEISRLAAVLSADPGILGPTSQPLGSASGLFRWPFLLAPGGTSQREQCFDRVEEWLASSSLQNTRVSGPVVQIARDSGELVRSQLRGLFFTLICLWGTMALGFRSLRLGLIGLIPNVLPCLIIYGSLALSGRPLSVVSAMIGSVMLGVIVDDTIHFLHAYSLTRSGGISAARSVGSAMASVGRPILVTSVVLGLGFGCGAAGSLETTVEFALLAGTTVFLALICDLFFLPAALLTWAASGSLPRIGD